MNESTHDFLAQIRGAVSMLNPTAHPAESVTPTSEIEAIEHALAGSALWLTNTVYTDYEAADFSEMPAHDRQELESLVHVLRHYVSEFPADQNPPAEVVEKAEPSFLRLVNLLDKYYPPTHPS